MTSKGWWMGVEPRDASVGIVTALAVETAAVRSLVDDLSPITVVGDPNAYRLGRLPSTEPGRPHTVVLTELAQDGTRSAAALTTDLLRSFPQVQSVIMCGVAGGVPHIDDPQRHVRLGDIVVASNGIVDYGHVRLVDGTERLRRDVEGLSQELLAANRELQTLAMSGKRPWEMWVTGKEMPAAFRRPDERTDVLAVDGEPVAHPDDRAERKPGVPRVHHAAIGSADVLLRDEAQRDRLGQRYDIRAIEMEAAGVAASASLHARRWFVVRGVADYCDSSKTTGEWQPYAARAAAAYVRALLAHCRPLGPATRYERVDPGMRRVERLAEITDALLLVEEIRANGVRDAFVAVLPPNLQSAIPRSAAARFDVVSIVRTCLEYRDGMEVLLDALRYVVPDSAQRSQAEMVIRTHWPALSTGR